MGYIHRFQTALQTSLFSIAVVLLGACNPVPLSVVASDFSINGVTGTSTNTTTANTAAASTTTASTTASTKTASTTTTAALTASNTNAVQNVTIDLTSKETCSDLTSLTAKVLLDKDVKINPDPAVARDYTSPVTFTVTEAYGAKVVYSVTVKGKACTTSATTPTVPGATPLTCTPAAISSTGYSLVFKACDTSNVNAALYYDKTECVRDNTTGLIWEGKTTSGLRAADNKYNNLDSTSLLQIPANNVPGTTALPARSPTQAEIDAPGNSIGYKNTVNALGLCGSKAWRMPTKDELQNIRIAGTTTQIDLTWFPNTDLNGYHATSTPFGAQAERASVVQFGAGTVDNWLRDGTVWDAVRGALPLRENSVRLVYSAP
jgi:hypothetical protein